MPLLSGITLRKLAGFILRTRRWELDEYEYGRAFDASERVTVPAGGTYEFLFVNPSSNPNNAYIIDMIIQSSLELDFDMYVDAEVTASGTKVPAVVKLVGSGNEPGAWLEHGGSYSGGQGPVKAFCPGGSRWRFAEGGEISIGVGFIVAPGHNLRIVLTNNNTSDTKTVLRVIWYEDKVA